MASMLIERKAGEFDPSEFHNRYVDALHELIEEKQKAKGEKVIEDPDADAPPPKGSNVIDLMAALKKSLGDEKKGRPKKAAGQEGAGQEGRRPEGAGDAKGLSHGRSRSRSTSRPTTASATSRRRRSRAGRKLKGKGDSFVVQKHDASRLHWDFRLELDGVLKSWAVPKGPSLDPGENRLAMRTEDHPLDYGGFEGTIPKGEYGGGTVMLWDQGRWIPEPSKDPSKTIEEGHLHFTLEGERMKGEWVMFRLKPKPGEKAEPWMLKKVTDEFAEPEDGDALVDNCVTSVTTGRTMAEIAAGEDVWRSNRGGQKGGPGEAKARARRRRRSRRRSWRPWSTTCRPATSWIHEYKYDGYRLLLAVGERRRDRLDPQRQGLERQVQGAGQGRGEAARRLPDRRRGGRARRQRQARASSCSSRR